MPWDLPAVMFMNPSLAYPRCRIAMQVHLQPAPVRLLQRARHHVGHGGTHGECVQRLMCRACFVAVTMTLHDLR